MEVQVEVSRFLSAPAIAVRAFDVVSSTPLGVAVCFNRHALL